jgi:diguanylate cyclase (GGDEF)-like protein/PAS domain S-box-containing protein
MMLSRLAGVVSAIKKWPIGKKIFLGHLFFLSTPLLVLCTFSLYSTVTRLHTAIEEGAEAAGSSIADMIELSIDASMRSYLRAIGEKNLQIVEGYHHKQLAGVLNEHDAKEAVVTLFRSQKIGRSGFISCIDAQKIPPFNRKNDLLETDHAHGEAFQPSRSFIRHLMAQRTGYLEYTAKSPTEQTLHANVLYMQYFKPWDWIISVGCDRKEFQELIDFNAIAQRMAAFKYGSSGYVLIFKEKGEILATPQDESGDRSAYSAQIQTILAAAATKNSTTIEYRGHLPGEKYLQQKSIFFKKIPSFGLIIGVVADQNQALTGLFSTRNIAFAAVLACALLSIAATFFISRLIAAPLHDCVRHLEDSPEHSGQIEYNGGCETTFLVEKFNQYSNNIKIINNKLNAEVQFRKSAETFLQIYKNIFDNATEGIFITDAGGKILAVNAAFTTITDYESSEIIGQNPRILQSGHHDPEFFEQMWQHLLKKGCWEGEIWNKRKDGTVYPQWLTINSIRNERKEISYYFAAFYELGELKKREKQIAFMAYHDILTRLPNRAYLEQKLAKSLHRIKKEGGNVSIFFIDLDNFKNVNDVFGHNQGDDLLVQVTQRFTSVLGNDDTLCRLGSDEFVLLMENIDNESIIYLMANRILSVLKKPFILEFKKIYINASIGISVYPGDGETGIDLIRSADMAMHKAKRDGKNRFILFTKGMHEALYQKFRTENGIRLGLLHREFIVYYQPKVNIHTRKTASLEALIRWEKGGQIISPNAFIPIAEESSLIDDICLFVMEETCAFHKIMQKHQVAVPVSVNISPRQFHNVDFVDIVEDLLGRYQVDPQFIEFEITETTAMKDVEHTLAIMHRIRQLGIQFSIDDFGTGYSSLGYLHKMPVSTLKIDKQFVDDLEANSGIVATIIAISAQMHLNVVAEGVETEEQLLSLGSMGCHEAQGYYFSRPVSGDNILQYLESERT